MAAREDLHPAAPRARLMIARPGLAPDWREALPPFAKQNHRRDGQDTVAAGNCMELGPPLMRPLRRKTFSF